ncbi:DUF1799 domain-containing protein [Pseudomonas sp. P8_250]|uniref:DUF1799 domain-containing protein n=1 Tax=Pseudomonas sp. P8_250 TaxID=3043446 RepID=UPI002A36A4DC|nr:DUF1799 domain-containing protein [Pseudomonas sp. P8_250]MDX9668763.1 DUF1799 domain-containing protein [Pseudomonas sp. P8_250]
MAAWGFSFGDLVEQEVEVWPDSWAGFMLFEAMSTQWKVGMGGAIGMDYQSLPVVAKYMEVPDELMPLAFNDIRVMESEVLKKMNEGKDK